MKYEIISDLQIAKRNFWVNEISTLSGNFGIDSEKVESEIQKEITKNGIDSLLGHLRLCGVIPECYGHDTSEEKLYSKYTDVVIHQTFLSMGLNSLVLRERADVADVECVTEKYSFVADAKAFRLSRTAKNQKDFKVQAMDNWKHGKPYAIVICPVYQLPSNQSQIYQQAAARSVCIGTYSHLAVLSRYSMLKGKEKSIELLHELFKTVQAMNPSKIANQYWSLFNKKLLDFDNSIAEIWKEEKIATIESIHISREEALTFLAQERERIMKLSREEAIKEVIKSSKIENKIRAIKSISDNGIMGMV